MSEQNIIKLTEMGFSIKQAENALSIANNNMEAAISYLFEEPIEIDPEEGKTLVKSNENLGDEKRDISEPIFVEDNDSYLQAAEYIHDIDSSSSDSDASNSEIEVSDNNDFNITKLLNTPKKNDIPIVFLKNSNFLVSFCVPIFSILSQIDAFVKLFTDPTLLSHDDREDEEDKNVSLDGDDNFNATKYEDSEHKFIAELQRFIGFVSGLSDRAYFEASNLTKNLPRSLLRDLSSNKIETADEFTTKLYEKLESSLSSNEQACSIFSDLFKSTVGSINEDSVSEVFNIDVDVEYRYRVIYESFNELFWGEDNEMIGRIAFQKLSSIINVQFIGDKNEISSSAFQLNEFFYPEIYSKDYLDAIIKMHSERDSAMIKRNRCTNEFMKLSLYEGKKMENILQHTLSYFKSINHDSDNLEEIRENFFSEKNSLAQELESLNNTYASCDISKYENVLKYLVSEGMKTPVKYILIGIIISDVDFFYRNNKTGEWIHQIAYYSYDNTLKHVEVTVCDFHKVQEVIFNYTSSVPIPLNLIYAQENLIGEKVEVINNELKGLFKEDNDIFQTLSGESDHMDQEDGLSSNLE